MTKPTYEELHVFLIRLTLIADNCIPSDNCTDEELAAAAAVVSEAWALIGRLKGKAQNVQA